MALDRYVLLERRAGATAGPFSTPSPSPAAATAEPPAIAVEVADLTPKEVGMLAKHSEVAALAPTMPIHLIRPLANGPVGPAAAGPTWGVEAVGASSSSFDGAGTVVGVLDTGIDTAHPAFAGVNVEEEDFSGSGNGDTDGHGTHCAGTIFGRDVQGTRIGVARGVTEARIAKVFGPGGSGDSEALFRAFTWALDRGADVISMSLGFDFPGYVGRLVAAGYPVPVATSLALEGYRANLRMFDALMALVKARQPFGGDAVVVAAAGNENDQATPLPYEVSVSIPAAADGVISVGAAQLIGGAYTIADFSNTLPEICAPGVDVMSAQAGGGLVSFQGTSMATPHVAGVACLWWQALRSQPLPASGRLVTARILAAADTSKFAAGVDVADRGVGMVRSPV
jgi:subtilisin family serine protease